MPEPARRYRVKRKDEPDDGQIQASQAQASEASELPHEPTTATDATRPPQVEPLQEEQQEAKIKEPGAVIQEEVEAPVSRLEKLAAESAKRYRVKPNDSQIQVSQAQASELPLLVEPEPTIATAAARGLQAEPLQEEHVAKVSDNHDETPSGDLGAGGSASGDQDAEGKTEQADKGAQALPAGVEGPDEDTQADGGGGQGRGKDTQADSLKVTDAFEKTLGSLYSEATTMQRDENTPGGSDKTVTSQAVKEGGENADSEEDDTKDDDTTPPVMKGQEENVPEGSPEVLEKPPVAAAHQDQEQEQQHRNAVDAAKPHPYAANFRSQNFRSQTFGTFIKRTVSHEQKKPCLRHNGSSGAKESVKDTERRKMQRKHTQRVRFYLPEEHMSAFSISVWDPKVSVVPRAW